MLITFARKIVCVYISNLAQNEQKSITFDRTVLLRVLLTLADQSGAAKDGGSNEASAGVIPETLSLHRLLLDFLSSELLAVPNSHGMYHL